MVDYPWNYEYRKKIIGVLALILKTHILLGRTYSVYYFFYSYLRKIVRAVMCRTMYFSNEKSTTSRMMLIFFNSFFPSPPPAATDDLSLGN